LQARPRASSPCPDRSVQCSAGATSCQNSGSVP
jgi:hypothetical protein